MTVATVEKILAMEIRPGMQIVEGRKAHRVLELPFPCSPYTKVHVKVEKKNAEGTPRAVSYCFDRNAEIEVTR